MSLSLKNGGIDTENRVFIYFSIEDVCEYPNVGKNKAESVMAELDSEKGIGLIEKLKKGQGKATVIYVKSFVRSASEVYISNFKNPKNQTSRSLKSKSLEVCNSNSNNNYIINNKINNNNSNLILSEDEKRTDMSMYAEYIRDNMEIDLLKENNPLDADIYEQIYDLVLETVLSQAEYIVIASNKFPIDVVRSRFLKLDSGHVGYVVDCLKKNTTKVTNIKKYMLASLFNAPTTISSYFRAEVNHDFAVNG